jgi:hypothetical protein
MKTNILHKIKSFGIDRTGLWGKSATIYANSAQTNSIYPLIYLRKPKGITNDEYDQLIDAIEIKFIIKDENNGK